jgi:hypothetical protein
VDRPRIFTRTLLHTTRTLASTLFLVQAMKDYKQATRAEEHKGRNLLERQTLWVKPACGWIKVNVDATLDKGTGKMGFGRIMRDHEGKFLAAKSITRMGSWDSIVAEAMAAYFGVIFSQEKGVQQMIL